MSPWTKSPARTVIPYQPSFFPRVLGSCMSRIFPATRKMIPNGKYLQEDKQKLQMRLVMSWELQEPLSPRTGTMMPRTGTTVPQDRNHCLQDRTGLLLGVRLFYLLRPDVGCLSITIENPVSLQPGSPGRPSPGHNTWWRFRGGACADGELCS